MKISDTQISKPTELTSLAAKRSLITLSSSTDVRQDYGEQRLCALGWFQGSVVHLTYTERDDDFHVISLRKAEKHEIKHYIKETTR